MTSPSRPPFFVVFIALALALGFVIPVNRGRQERVEHVTNLGAEEAVKDPRSPTGWAAGRRWLIASEHNNTSYEWILQTQQMLTSGEWWLRRVGYDNAPGDRPVDTASPYRWWLALVAQANHALTGNPLPLAVERAALYADPILLALVLVVGTGMVAFTLGAWPAAVFAVGVAMLFPFGASFAPGAPDSLGLSLALGLLALFATAMGGWLRDPAQGPCVRCMVVAGVMGGLGLWANAFFQLSWLLAMTLAALAAVLVRQDHAGTRPGFAWRVWGIAGAATSLAAWAIEAAPDTSGLKPAANHPFMALAWLGAAEWIAQLAEWRNGMRTRSVAGWIRLGLAVAALVALPWFLHRAEIPWIQGRDVFGTRLSSVPLAAAATDFGAWWKQEGDRRQLAATLLPFLWLVVPLWLASRRATPATMRAGLVFLLVTLGVLIPIAWTQLRWWSAVDAVWLLTVVVALGALARTGQRIVFSTAVASLLLALVPGAFAHWPVSKANYENALTPFEAEGVVERNLAHWLAAHSATPPLVLAPPFRTTSLAFHGNLRGVGSLNVANKDAMNAAARIASATSPDEALALVTQRGVTHLIVPSWDDYLYEYARIFTARPENSFIYALRNWAIPPWLRPVAFQLPGVGGFENQNVLIFEVVEEQDAATSLSRMTEYFIEMGQGQLVQSAARGLASYPGNLPALVALAQSQQVQGDGEGFRRTLAALKSTYDTSEEHDLAWDRRVSLMILFLQAQQRDAATREMEICLNLVDEAKLKSLSVGTLFRFQIALKALGRELPTPALRELAPALLPESLRARL